MNIAIGIAVLLLLLFAFRHRLFPAKTSRRAPKQKCPLPESLNDEQLNKLDPNAHPFHCVSVESKSNICAASKKIIGKRFLSRLAPKLPLTQCSNPSCRCRYTHHEDRREPNSDRRIGFGLQQELYGAYGEQNRRQNPKGRRVGDY